MTTEQIIYAGILALLGSIVGSSILVEIYKRKNKIDDDRTLYEDELTKEEIVDRREMAREFREDIKEIKQIERALREERTADKTRIAVQELMLDEKDKALIARDRRIEELQREIEELRSREV